MFLTIYIRSQKLGCKFDISILKLYNYKKLPMKVMLKTTINVAIPFTFTGGLNYNYIIEVINGLIIVIVID